LKKKPKKPKYVWPAGRLVEIEWDDAATSQLGWESITRYQQEEVARARSVGYLIRDDDRQVVIVQSQIANQTGVMREIAIPKGMVIRMKTIRSGF